MAEELQFSQESREYLKCLENRCDSLRIKRNEFVHALWGSAPDMEIGKLTAVVVKARRKLKVALNSHEVEAIHGLAEEISNLSLEIANEANRLKSGK